MTKLTFATNLTTFAAIILLSALGVPDEANASNPLTQVDIDIKPGSDPNSINLCSEGVVPVAILGSDSFDVNDIDSDTLRLADSEVKVAGRSDRELCSVEDVNDDGILDLVCHFVTVELGLTGGDTEATVRGELLDGTPFEGTDSVNLVKDGC